MDTKVFAAGLVVVASMVGVFNAANNSSRAQKPTPVTARNSSVGHVDVGAQVDFNVYAARISLLLGMRDADVLVIRAINWAAREIRYVLNGQDGNLVLSEEQLRQLLQGSTN